MRKAGGVLRISQNKGLRPSGAALGVCDYIDIRLFPDFDNRGCQSQEFVAIFYTELKTFNAKSND